MYSSSVTPSRFLNQRNFVLAELLPLIGKLHILLFLTVFSPPSSSLPASREDQTQNTGLTLTSHRSRVRFERVLTDAIRYGRYSTQSRKQDTPHTSQSSNSIQSELPTWPCRHRRAVTDKWHILKLALHPNNKLSTITSEQCSGKRRVRTRGRFFSTGFVVQE